MNDIVSCFPERFFELRQRAAAEGWHRKLPEQAAFLGFALETAISFFYERGILSEAQGQELIDEGWEIFRALAEKNQRRIAEENPIILFGDILATLVHQHAARLEPIGDEGETLGAADRIGWYDPENKFLCLIPTAAWHAVQRYCIMENTHFPFSKSSFFSMLKTRKIIMPGPDGNTVVQRIKGKTYRVLKIIDAGMFQKTVIL